MRKKIYKVTASVLTVSLCFALAGCSKEEAKSETVSSSANSVEPKATAEPAATPEPRKELTLTKLDVKEPNNIAVNGYLELPTVDALHHFPAEEEAGAGDGTAGAQEHPGVV